MPVRVRYKITAYVSSTTAEEKDLASQTWEVMTDTQGEGGSWKSTLQPGDGTPHTVVTGSGVSGDDITGTAPSMTLEIATGAFNSSMIGMDLVVSGATTPANSGTFTITSVTPTSVSYTNSVGSAEAFTGNFQVNATEPVQIVLGNLITARLLIIRTNSKDPTQVLGQIYFRKNSVTGEEFTVQPIGDSKEGHLLISTNSITALYASNPISGVPTEITVISAGD